MSTYWQETYDVVVVGAGHAGCEAALAAARLGARTVLVTMNPLHVALMPCNPSIGGPAKGHLVREVDALGGAMGAVIDRTLIQIRLLNTGKGPAVQALRAQADKHAYNAEMTRVLAAQPNLTVKRGLVADLLTAPSEGPAGKRISGILLADGGRVCAAALVLCTGTSLNGRCIRGEESVSAGRAGEPAANALSSALRALGYELGRLKTGTPPRLDRASIDWSKAEVQAGSPTPLFFSEEERLAFAAAPDQPDPWKEQIPCHIIHTTPETHRVIRENLHRAPMFNGSIEGVGPRYCPSIEDKIVRFASKDAHQLFLEPEGRYTREIYVQGANTSLPADVQDAMLRAIPALRDAVILRPGYAVEYDMALPYQTLPSLGSRLVDGLYLAGQINGTSGYEEAAAQGLMAGLNAARHTRDQAPVVLRRDQAYIGVLIDDLVTKDHREPYRMHTSRAEHRLMLRQDNADLRLADLAYESGLIDAERYARVSTIRRLVATTLETLGAVRIHGVEGLSFGHAVPLDEALRRPEVTFAQVAAAAPSASGLVGLPTAVGEQVELETKYAGYITREKTAIARAVRMEEHLLAQDLDYMTMRGLRNEAREKLTRFRPLTVGQAGRLAGVTPADIAALLVHVKTRTSQDQSLISAASA